MTFFGFASDLVGRKGWFTKTFSRKLFETIALVFPAICLGLIPKVGCDQNQLIALLILAMVFFGAQTGGDVPIVIDLAPDYSGSLYGIVNAFASTPGFLAPLFVGVVLDHQVNIGSDCI